MPTFMLRWLLLISDTHSTHVWRNFHSWSCYLLMFSTLICCNTKQEQERYKWHSYGNCISIIEMWSLIYLHKTFFLKASYCIFPKQLPNHFIPIISLHVTFHFIIIQPLYKDYKRKKKMDILCEQMNVWGPFTSKETNR